MHEASVPHSPFTAACTHVQHNEACEPHPPLSCYPFPPTHLLVTCAPPYTMLLLCMVFRSHPFSDNCLYTRVTILLHTHELEKSTAQKSQCTSARSFLGGSYIDSCSLELLAGHHSTKVRKSGPQHPGLRRLSGSRHRCAPQAAGMP